MVHGGGIIKVVAEVATNHENPVFSSSDPTRHNSKIYYLRLNKLFENAIYVFDECLNPVLLDKYLMTLFNKFFGFYATSTVCV